MFVRRKHFGMGFLLDILTLLWLDFANLFRYCHVPLVGRSLSIFIEGLEFVDLFLHFLFGLRQLNISAPDCFFNFFILIRV